MAQTTQTKPAPTWDLESIFPGGSGSKQYADYRAKAKAALETLGASVKALPHTLGASSADKWEKFILDLQAVSEKWDMILSFAYCLSSGNVDDSGADKIVADGTGSLSEWSKIKTEFEALAGQAGDAEWNELLKRPALAPVAFPLNEIRDAVKEKMPLELEKLALDLGVSGYHGWNHLYDKMSGELRVDWEEGGETKSVSLGQLATKMSHPDRSVRQRAFEKMVAAWKSRADLCALELNSMTGFRLALIKGRGWKDALHEPLKLARLTRASLEAMWAVVGRESHRLKPYIEAKKKLLKIDKFRWYDQIAPCGESDKQYSFEEAGKFIIKHDAAFSTDMADFIKYALDNRWIEAEDRPGKRGGGYCTRFGPYKQGRIFMTYANSYDSMMTLAHELGHLYHGFVLKDREPFAQHYPMTLAETASTFNELLVTDAALAESTDPQEKLMLLDQKLQQPFVMFCDLRSRFLFEKSFTAERVNGSMDKERLNELMVAAQKEAFGDILDPSGFHPLFWASKLHFHISEFGFYNFPYTFGFLFAGGVYNRAKEEGKQFANKYRAMLADTGVMTTEEVAKKHLDVDLTQETFWTEAVNRSIADVDAFVKLAGKLS